MCSYNKLATVLLFNGYTPKSIDDVGARLKKGKTVTDVQAIIQNVLRSSKGSGIDRQVTKVSDALKDVVEF